MAAVEETEPSQLQRAWENARELITQENDLVNHRITAWLSIQAFLFAALILAAVSLASDNSKDYRWLIALLALIVCVVGYVSCVRIEPAIRAAYRHVNATNLWWLEYKKNESDYRERVPFPPPIGRAIETHWLPPWRLHLRKRSADHTYDELQFDEKKREEIDKIFLMGAPKLIGLFYVVWFLFFILGIVFFIYVVPSKRVNSTVITISEDSTSREVTVSFKGEMKDLADLERRIGALPGTVDQSLRRIQPPTAVSGSSASAPGESKP